MGGLAWWHWLIIIAAFILIFGARKLPDAARGVGRSLRILKSEVNAMHEDDAKRETKPAETDASAQVATPAAQLAPAPIQQPPVQQPVQQQPYQQQPVQQPAQQQPYQQQPVQQQPPVQQPPVQQQPVQQDQYQDPTRPAGS